MKTRLKHLLAAAIPFWLAQAVVLLTGYTDVDVILRMYLPVFVLSAVLVLLGQYWAGHGVWLFPTVGLVVEYVLHLSRGDKPNMGGAFVNIAISLVGFGLCILLQLAVNKRKKKKLATPE